MRGAIVTSWGAGVPGREKMALEVFGKALAFAETKLKQGLIESHEEYFAITGGGGEPNGFMLVRGEVEDLLKLQADEEWLRLINAAALIVQNFGTQTFGGGNEEAVQQVMGIGMSVESEMGLL